MLRSSPRDCLCLPVSLPRPRGSGHHLGGKGLLGDCRANRMQFHQSPTSGCYTIVENGLGSSLRSSPATKRQRSLPWLLRCMIFDRNAWFVDNRHDQSQGSSTALLQRPLQSSTECAAICTELQHLCGELLISCLPLACGSLSKNPTEVWLHWSAQLAHASAHLGAA